MDSLMTAAARALAAGDPLGALNRVALRDDALALRGIAMAQLGDFPRAKTLLRRASRAFGAKEAVARARCVVAEAEIALASRELAWPAKALDHARATLEAHGDRINAAHARYLDVRRALLIGRIDEAEDALRALDASALPPRCVPRMHDQRASPCAVFRQEKPALRWTVRDKPRESRALPRCQRKSNMRARCSIRPLHGSSRKARRVLCCSTMWKHCSHRTRS